MPLKDILAALVVIVLWGRLLARHPVTRIAPLSLLVPVVGLLCADWFLGEKLGLWQWLGGGVVLIGLVVNPSGMQAARWAASRRRSVGAFFWRSLGGQSPGNPAGVLE